MSPPVAASIPLVVAYLVGAIPVGYIVGRLRGVNLFTAGSGNIGATNAARVLGKPFGVLVFVFDFLKGAVPVVLAVPLAEALSLGSGSVFGSPDVLRVLAAALAFLGHLFPVYLGFRGGKKIENPQSHPSLMLQSSIAISKRPIPPSKPDAIPRVVTGAAVWTDMAEKAPKTNKFSVYVVGLSNGQATEELRTGEKLIKRKTLQINFIRPTDDNRPLATDIRPDDANGPAEQWIYRTTSVAKAIGGPAPKLPPPPPEGK